MGASASTNKQSIQNTLTSEAYNSCPNITASNTANISGVSFKPNPGCVNPQFLVNQSAGIDANCLITSLQDSLAQTISKLDAKSQAGLGFSASTNVNDIKTQIKQMVKNTCGNQSSTNVANINDTIITACDFRIVQNATDQSSCSINALQKQVDSVAASAAANATGGSIWGDLFGSSNILKTVIIIVVIVAVIAAIAGGGYAIYRYQKNKKQTTNETGSSEEGEEAHEETGEEMEGETGETQEGGLLASLSDPNKFVMGLQKNKSYSALIIMILIIIVIFLAFSSKTDKPFTKNDIADLKKTMDEAHQIAGLKTGLDYDERRIDSDSYLPIPLHVNYISKNIDSVSGRQILSENLEIDPFVSSLKYHNTLNDYYKPLLS